MNASTANRLEDSPFNLMPDDERISENMEKFTERRKKADPMSEQDFRQQILHRLDQGTEQFAILSQFIDSLQNEVAENNLTVNDRLHRIQQEIADNTKLTKEAGDTAKEAKDIAEKTSKDTAGLVGMYKSANSAVDTMAIWSERISKASKLMTPILVLGALITMLAHGKFPSWSDMIKLLG